MQPLAINVTKSNKTWSSLWPCQGFSAWCICSVVFLSLHLWVPPGAFNITPDTLSWVSPEQIAPLGLEVEEGCSFSACPLFYDLFLLPGLLFCVFNMTSCWPRVKGWINTPCGQMRSKCLQTCWPVWLQTAVSVEPQFISFPSPNVIGDRNGTCSLTQILTNRCSCHISSTSLALVMDLYTSSWQATQSSGYI